MTQQSRALLELSVSEKRYDDVTVLGRLDLRVGRGEIVSLVGPSGCGKSTLLRIVAGLDRAYRGTTLLDGHLLREPSPRVGVMFQEPRLLPWLRVVDNVRFAKLGHADDKRRAESLLAEVGLRDALQHWPKQLSGGMAQRVALARALYTQPDLLLLDEPFSAVDALTRVRLQTLLLEVIAAHGAAALIVTHDLDEALFLSDRVCLMGAAPGRIVESFDVDVPRPRKRGDPAFVTLKTAMLERLEQLERLRDPVVAHGG